MGNLIPEKNHDPRTHSRSTSISSTNSSQGYSHDKGSHPLPQWLQGHEYTGESLILWIGRLAVATVALVLLYTTMRAARSRAQELSVAKAELATYEKGIETWLHPDGNPSVTHTGNFTHAFQSPLRPSEIPDDSHIERLAIMTFYSQSTSHNLPPSADHYFQATRLLGYQLLHSPSTRIPAQSLLTRNRTIDFVVLVTPDVSAERRSILTEDGVTVIPVDPLHVPGDEWLLDGGAYDQWKDLMTKFRAWQLTQYSRVLFVDSDTVIMKAGIEGIFDDAGALFQRRLEGVERGAGEKDVQVPIPEQYLMASLPEPKPNHEWPPTFEGEEHPGYPDENYLCAGFFMFGPSLEVFDYFTSLIPIPHLFDARLMEQSLLNYAHRRAYNPPTPQDGGFSIYPQSRSTGPLPWTNLHDHRWNVRYPKQSDVIGPDGAVTVHEKYWHAQMDDANEWDERMTGFLSELKGEMEGWYSAQQKLREEIGAVKEEDGLVGHDGAKVADWS